MGGSRAPADIPHHHGIAALPQIQIKQIFDEEVPFAKGGRPRLKQDLIDLGFDLSNSIDPGKPILCQSTGKVIGYKSLSEDQKNVLYTKALRWWWVWSRDARAPETSRLVVLDIPTGDAEPIAQKPYPIPYAYRDAVRDELQKILDGEAQHLRTGRVLTVRIKILQ